MSSTFSSPASASESRGLSATSKYSKFLRYSHWIAVVLVVAAYAAAIYSNDFLPRRSPERQLGLKIHFMIGLILLLVTIPRIVKRLKTKKPPIVPPQHVWGDRLASAAHLLLYAFLVVMPILGVIVRMTGGNGLGIPFTSIIIPSVISDRALSHKFEDVHVWIAEAFYYVIGLHVVAAFYHFLIRKDNTLQRMV